MKYIVQEEKIKPIKILFEGNTIEVFSTDSDFTIARKLSPLEVEEFLAIVFGSPNMYLRNKEK